MRANLGVKPKRRKRFAAHVTPAGVTGVHHFKPGAAALAVVLALELIDLIEREAEYAAAIRARIDRMTGADTPLFGGGS